MKDFEKFISYFPIVELPILLSDDALTQISANNDILPELFIHDFIGKWEANMESEFLEFLPCIQLKMENEKIKCIVYWRGDILKYDFVLVTLDNEANLIDRKVICGTQVDGDIIKRSVASIEADNIINIVAGAFDSKNGEYNALASQNFAMEVLANGEIAFMKE